MSIYLLDSTLVIVVASRQTTIFRSSGELGELAIHQGLKGALLVYRDPGSDTGREVLEGAPGFVWGSSLDVSEGSNILVNESLPVCRGLVRRSETGVLELHQRRLQRAPPEVDHQRLDQHEFGRELRQTRH